MIKRVTCIECPRGCILSVEIEGRKVVKLSGNECPKGEGYAVSEIENPVRILTSTVLTEGLSLKMVPIKTDRPIPKDKILEAMKEIKRIRLKGPVNVGDVVVEDFLNLGVNLIATRLSLARLFLWVYNNSCTSERQRWQRKISEKH